MFSLTGKTALVTGAASGIGTSIAQTFVQAGARVYLADKDLEGAKTLAAQLGSAAIPLELNVTDEEECRQAAGRVGLVDILVNNAGVGTVGTILQTSGEEFDRILAVNVRGIFNVCKAFLPAMVEAQKGNIINVASVGGVVGIRDRLAYCTSKFAVVGLTKSMALDHAEARIRVNCICPGRVETPFVSARLKEYPDPGKAYAEMSSTQLFGRMIAPQEVAYAALYLASDEAFMITGSDLRIDCGWSAGK